MTELQQALDRELDGEVLFDDYTRHLFSRDASMYAITPIGVVAPRHAGDVVTAVRIAREHGVPVLPRGGGTSLAGQTVGEALVLDFSRHMSAIVELDPEARTARVQPGVVQDQLNRAAAAHGLMFGPDTSTSNRATIGGMIGNNSAGSGSVRYGMTIDHVRSLDVVLSDASTARFGPVDEAERARRAAGDTLEARLYRELPALVDAHRDAIATGFPKFWRRAGGYRLDRLAEPIDGAPFDLARFVVGSEGTLVVATEAEVGLVPKPSRTVIAVGHFRSTQAAINATEDALACEPAAVELLDRTILDLSRSKLEYAALGSILHDDPDALLFVSFTGDDADELSAQLNRLDALWKRHGHGYHTLLAETAAQQAALLKVRKAGLGLLMAASSGANRPVAFVEDTAVGPDRLAEYSERFAKVLERNGMRAGFYGHASVGCLHVRPFVDLSRPEEVAKMRAVAEEVRDLVAEFGGANSSEHGDGLARSEFNRHLFGDELYEAMRRVKGIFDPEGRMNPGKIVDAPSMTDNLREPALPPAGPLTTMLDFTVVAGGQHGMRGAADRCMNIGLCRKDDVGVMCPSYMATHREEDATRGRANALVKALSEPDPSTALGDERLHEVLDLCLMCKACKSECPLSVDMATLKAEALHHKHETKGIPLRSRVFAGIRGLNRLGAASAPMANLPNRVPALRKLMARAIGIAPERPLPVFAQETLLTWFHGRGRQQSHFHDATRQQSHFADTGSRGPLTFLGDSFTSFTEPAIGIAAIELLERAGWDVRLESNGCCGRAAFSKGMLDQAKRQASGLVDALAGTEGPIAGVEPSCVLTLGDEHRALLGADDPRVTDVAGRARLVDELLVEAIDDGALRLRDDAWPAGKRILYHGHCHQKAEVGTAATVALLSRIPGAVVVEVDAGCCGMAGSFGFEAEHYEVSMKVGEDRLFPAVRAEPEGTVIAATGVSCRQQIAHGTTRRAHHPVELIRAALA
ncbi:FAD-binding and (Fe-S)-binding domain-containing protein [Pseudonocardia cypriaca]|uniref:FAD/FMN-containing dehydrogenase n=1 Tax=Pseudonocardia cypriaca TaxID=882449 RepID=A0A543FYU9_9PSEU|nr:FAD-binding and (Fe-S)-binding domain-containing protein [Pseudonocardia cypriaca]TQM38989.1 FAD/FMN-containing dehydrogenase [Pseudonocardia cypriaca]